MVANLIDNYLAEVASDVNLKLKKFQSLVATVTDFARSIDEGISQGTSMADRFQLGAALSIDGLSETVTRSQHTRRTE